ncbi:MAG: PD40 domain-containing protein, partial [Verrucomicrobia bacterium]|nr:PD40 domain-containing protein [Verrucomicrobiota bacterium]
MQLLVSIFLLSLGLCCFAQTPAGYYRFPAIHGDTIVFTSEGDLWRVPVAGGTAQRLTTHPGLEAHAAISPDGKTVAFSAEYEGPAELYTMPLAGGVPTRHTFTSSNPRTIAWTAAGRVLYATESLSTLPSVQLVSLNPKTGGREPLPLAQASDGAFDPETQTLFFTRLPKQGSSTKRYQGGWIENLWRFRNGDDEAVLLTPDFKGTSRNPLWWNGRLYFVSDRDGIMNLWSMKADGSDLQQLTKHTGYDVKSAALDAGRIVYQHGADLRLYDIRLGTDAPLDITLASDFDQKREKWVKKPIDYLTAAHVSPNGDRLALTARGQVFVAPVEQGRFVEAPRKPGVRYRNARFLADSKSLLVQSDESGEIEFWKLAANGLGQPEALTTDGKVFRFEGAPAPDGQWIAWGDKDLKFWVYHLQRREIKLIAEVQDDNFGDFAWSPDSQWLAYVESATNTYRQIKLYRVGDGTRATVTSDRVESFNPTWSPDGKWLYFLSNREIRSLAPSPWGPRQPDPFFADTTKIYQVALTKGLRSPFAPKDELQGEEPEKSEKKSGRSVASRALPHPGPLPLGEGENATTGIWRDRSSSSSLAPQAFPSP